MLDNLKLYVWEDVLHDYTAGMMVALAHNANEARVLLLEKCDYLPQADISQEPVEITEPAAFFVYGGG